jgi:hypothetical protein
MAWQMNKYWARWDPLDPPNAVVRSRAMVLIHSVDRQVPTTCAACSSKSSFRSTSLKLRRWGNTVLVFTIFTKIGGLNAEGIESR